MSNLNKVILIGNLTRDIELQKTQGGISVCSFPIAVNRMKAQDGTQGTDFPQIVVWRQTAELCAKYLQKGSKIAVEGHLQTRSYEKNGVKVYATDVVAEHVEFLNGGQGQRKQEEEYTEVEDDDIPF